MRINDDDIAPLGETPPQKRSGMAQRVLNGSQKGVMREALRAREYGERVRVVLFKVSDVQRARYKRLSNLQSPELHNIVYSIGETPFVCKMPQVFTTNNQTQQTIHQGRI